MIKNINYKIKISQILLTLVSSFMLASCLVNDEIKPVLTKEDYFVFGRYYGRCHGERCIEIYKIENGKIFEDDLDLYPVGLSEFNFVEQNDNKYQVAKNLANNFPNELLANPDTTFGMPDYYDQGGMYVEKKINGIRKFWRLDNHSKNMPDFLSNYSQEITKVMDSLSVLQ